jgi:hypothetical protein
VRIDKERQTGRDGNPTSNDTQQASLPPILPNLPWPLARIINHLPRPLEPTLEPILEYLHYAMALPLIVGYIVLAVYVGDRIWADSLCFVGIANAFLHLIPLAVLHYVTRRMLGPPMTERRVWHHMKSRLWADFAVVGCSVVLAVFYRVKRLPWVSPLQLLAV